MVRRSKETTSAVSKRQPRGLAIRIDRITKKEVMGKNIQQAGFPDGHPL